MINLTEYIHPYMDILFLALNAPVRSNDNEHWFSGNLSFWNVLYRSGLITEPISDPLIGDVKVFGSNQINHKNWVYGVTDLNRRDVETDSSNVKVLQQDVIRIHKILDSNTVKRLCLLHSKVGDEFRKASADIDPNGNRYGYIGDYKDTQVFEVPFHNASIAVKERYYRLMTTGDKLNESKNTPTPNRSIETQSQSLGTFIIPDAGNSITQKDIEKGQLRITVNYKHYFPNNSNIVLISYGTTAKQVAFTHRGSKSHILNVGKDFFYKYNIREGDRVRFDIIKRKEQFVIRKV